MLTTPNSYDTLLGSGREVDFLLPKIRVQSRLEKFNHFSLTAEMHPFLLEEKMKICKDGRIWGQNNKEAGSHLGIKTGRDRHVKRGYNPNSAKNKAKFRRGDQVGEKNTNWKGGTTILQTLLRNSVNNKQWRLSVFIRDNFTCQDCGRHGFELEAHHRKEFSDILKEFLYIYNQFSPIEDKETLVRLTITYEPFWDLENGITLCLDCHQKYHLFCPNR